MSNLLKPVYTKKSWGHEVIWSLTSHFMAKTLEIDPFKITELMVFERKEKAIIVVKNALSLAIGDSKNENSLEYIDYPEGWSFYIAPLKLHRYGATDKPVRIIEISSPELDEAIVIDKPSEIGS
jgi:hypothetical protein